MRPISQHAAERQMERSITRNHIKLCMKKGTRTSVPHGDRINPWRHKYMHYGLHVICSTEDGAIITAYWCADEPADIEKSIAMYAELLKNEYGRAETRKTKRTHRKKRIENY